MTRTTGRGRPANIAHKLAHGLLLHPPNPPFDRVSHVITRRLEAEANWLGSRFWRPMKRRSLIAELVAGATDRYGASSPLVRMSNKSH